MDGEERNNGDACTHYTGTQTPHCNVCIQNNEASTSREGGEMRGNN